LWKRLAVLVAAAVIVVTMLAAASPAFAAPDGTNRGNSLEHRSNASGKGNFGQCHKIGFVQGRESRTFNPSGRNAGEADCRQVEGRGVQVTTANIANCGEGREPQAQGEIIFQPRLAFGDNFARCVPSE
jgi:hypothetical protein